MMHDDDTLIERLKLVLKEGSLRHPDHHWVKAMANPPASPADLLRAETLLGYPLPPPLRRIYLEVANGGIGPGYGGLFPLFTREGQDSNEEYSLVNTTLEYRRSFVDTTLDSRFGSWDSRSGSWPEKLCVICHWGCAILSMIDCSHPEYPILREYRVEGDDDAPGVLESPSLHQWLQDWLDRKPMFYFAYKGVP